MGFPIIGSPVFSYTIPVDLRPHIQVGMLVRAPLGRRGNQTGIVFHLHSTDPDGRQLSSLTTLVDAPPIVGAQTIHLWEWVCEYYLNNIGDLLRVSVPTTYWPEEKFTIKFEKLPPNIHSLPVDQQEILYFLRDKKTIAEQHFFLTFPARKYGGPLQLCLQNRYVSLQSMTKGLYQPKREPYFFWTEQRPNEAAFTYLQNRYKRNIAIKTVLAFMRGHEKISATQLRQAVGNRARAAIKRLLSDSVLYERSEDTAHLQLPDAFVTSPRYRVFESAPTNPLSEALIHKPVLLFSAYRREEQHQYLSQTIYHVLREHGQVLWVSANVHALREDFALYERLFAEYVHFLSAHTNINHEHELYGGLSRGKPCLVFAQREGILLPFSALKLIIIDEEHCEYLHRKSAPPYFHARDTALFAAQLYGAKVVLLSTTPSIQTFFHVKHDQYGWVRLDCPAIQASLRFISQAAPPKRATGGRSAPILLPDSLQEALEHLLDNQKNIFLLKQRVGYSSFFVCDVCGHALQCDHCDVFLTYFKEYHLLRCRYCTKQYPYHAHCTHCLSGQMVERKFGTERIEEDVAALFPNHTVIRIDSDHTLSQKKVRALSEAIAQNRGFICVGTTVIFRYLPAHMLDAACVFDTEMLLRVGGYRSTELGLRSLFAIREKFHPDQPTSLYLHNSSAQSLKTLSYWEKGDFFAFLTEELSHRKAFCYPPYSRMVLVIIKHKDKQKAEQTARTFIDICTQEPLHGAQILGPSEPFVSKIRDEHLMEVNIKTPKSHYWTKQGKQKLNHCKHATLRQPQCKGSKIFFFVDG